MNSLKEVVMEHLVFRLLEYPILHVIKLAIGMHTYISK